MNDNSNKKKETAALTTTTIRTLALSNENGNVRSCDAADNAKEKHEKRKCKLERFAAVEASGVQHDTKSRRISEAQRAAAQTAKQSNDKHNSPRT